MIRHCCRVVRRTAWAPRADRGSQLRGSSAIFLPYRLEFGTVGADSGCRFASAAAGGKVPVWPSSLMEDYIRPAAPRAGITKHITWQFRHTLATSFAARGENVKTVQDAMRETRGSYKRPERDLKPLLGNRVYD